MIMKRILIVALSLSMLFFGGASLSASTVCDGGYSYSVQKPEKKEKPQKKAKKDKKAKKGKKGEVPPAVEAKPEKKGPESMDKFIKKDAQVKDGLVKVIRQDDKYYFAVPD